MNLCITTKVEQDYRTVFNRFDLKLFLKLKPPLVSFNILRFDGCKPGDEVILEISILGNKQQWNALITEQFENGDMICFIDTGKVLPKPLTYWKHKHIIENCVDSSKIIDDICFETGNKLLNYLLFPLIFMQFYYRKPIYKSYFRK
ncbi:MAG: hypothetical protein IT281_01220 [Ignavibacteria bacterium]|nr:hypothetical protein [Ignavibacteria bacterium]MCC7158141.1 hypothetical protein [Ignavibacteria bacterium]